jgi:hypothetical protein
MNLVNKFKLDFITPNTPEKSKQRIDQSRESKFIDEKDRVSDIASDISFLLKELYLLGRIDDAFQEIENIGSSVFNSLMGEWQKTELTDDKKIDPAWWHKTIPWYSNIRDTLMWCSTIQDWNGIKKVLSFMDEKVKNDKCGIEGKIYYIALRHHFENQKQQRDTLLDEVISSRNKKYRQQAETLKSIFLKDKDVTKKNWESVFKRWLQQEAKMDWYLAPEATFLYYFALENGIFIPLQENQKNHIINFDQQKGKH